MIELYNAFMDILPLEYWADVISQLKLIGAIISIISLAVIAFFLRKSKWLHFHYLYDLRDFFFQEPIAAKRFLKQWEDVKRRIVSPNESDWKLAIIEADKLIDEVVKNMGVRGITLGERLNNLPEGMIQNIDDLWRAHKVRNNIVHDPDFRLSYEHARDVIDLYERVLREFELI